LVVQARDFDDLASFVSLQKSWLTVSPSAQKSFTEIENRLEIRRVLIVLD